MEGDQRLPNPLQPEVRAVVTLKVEHPTGNTS
jgi:hypothetical protein